MCLNFDYIFSSKYTIDHSILLDYTLHDAAIEAGVVDYLLVILTNQLKHNDKDCASAAVSVVVVVVVLLYAY